MLLLADKLSILTQGIILSRQTLAIIRQNIGWAITYNVVALPLAAAGLLAPWMAALGMSLSSLLVVANALRLSSAANPSRDSRVPANSVAQ
jgi:Cu2+-exporting ATPase